MMKRDQCFRVLARHVADAIVVASYSSAVEWLEQGERTLNYFCVGAMGLDSSHALGLALGRSLYVHVQRPLPGVLLAQAALVTAVAVPVILATYRKPRPG